MTSQLAIDEVNALWAAGLHPTVRDIVRLNSLALAVEDARGRYVRDALSMLPRVAVVGTRRRKVSRGLFRRAAFVDEPVFFRQPTIGHEEWLARAVRWCAEDYETILALNCYALSRPLEDLCNADDLECVHKAVVEYSKTMARYTRDQLYAAIRYAKLGADPLDGENGPAPRKRKGDTIRRDESDVDWDECVAVGVLHEGAAVLWGLSLSEMRRMTRGALEATIRRAYFFHDKLGLSGGMEKTALGNFYAVLEEIKARLKMAVLRRAAQAAKEE